MPFAPLPSDAAWRHEDARDGFKISSFTSDPAGRRLSGVTTALEAGAGWSVSYCIDVTRDWRTRRAEVTTFAHGSGRTIVLEHDGAGNWQIDGVAASHLSGCLDIDLESSALTNALPVHRLSLAVSQSSDAPAAYVRAADLAVERLEQHYGRIADGVDGQRYEYRAPAFGFACELSYDSSGLVTSYPGIAVRVR